MRTITRAAAVGLFLFTLTAVSSAQAVNITGTWLFNVETSGGSGQPTVTFTQDGEKLTGHYSSQTLGEADFTGTVKGSAVQFTFNANAQGQEIDVAYAGTVDGGSMKGTVNMAGGQLAGSFTAKKQ
ncbi:MAG: hypothetical protein OEW19_07940 [Acidobacteriota bacterium]|nr:hypothetical protein [Acidobacteriota bacterium]